MFIARRTFSCDYDGETVSLVAGRSRVAPDHELVRRFPDAFESAPPSLAVVDRGGCEFRATDPRGRRHALYSGDQLDRALDERLERIRQQADRPGAIEAGISLPGSDVHTGRNRDPWQAPLAADAGPGDLRARALTANERSERMPDAAREHMARQLEQDDDPQARLARFTVELSRPAYFRAFAKWLRDPVSGGHEWTDEEREAVQRARWVERSMVLGTGSAGGFLVPYELDPNILISSAGYVDPLRALARVDTVAQNEKRYVTSDGVTAHWYDEAAEVSDDTPVLAQPTVTCRKAMAFVPVSFELYEDSSIAQQIGAVFADAKAALEANAFTLGTGTAPQPKGIITAVAAVAGSVVTTSATAFAAAEVVNNQNALPARWRPRAKFMANLSVLNGYRTVIKGTGLTESIVDDTGPVPRMLGWEVHENSSMDGTITGGAAADYLLLSGDFQQYAICDRIGTTLEVVSHLFGSNRRPSGQRGFLMHWRVGADVLIADAFRLTNYSA